MRARRVVPMTRKITTETYVLQAFHNGRGQGEWAACNAALKEFQRLHPDASAEFAEAYIARTLSSIAPGKAE
jgi:hypothetical protein